MTRRQILAFLAFLEDEPDTLERADLEAALRAELAVTPIEPLAESAPPRARPPRPD